MWMHLENIILSESYQAQDPIYMEGDVDWLQKDITREGAGRGMEMFFILATDWIYLSKLFEPHT